MKKLSLSRCALAAITLSSAAALTACGGGGNAEPPATSAAVANTTPSTILPPTTTTTTAPNTELPAAVTTQPPTTQTAPLSEEEQAKQAVIAAAEHAWWLFNEAKLDPTNDQKRGTALAIQVGEARSRVEQVLDDYVALHQRSQTLDSLPAWVDVDESSVEVDLVAGTASLELCHLNSNVLLDSSNAVLDDKVIAVHASEQYTRVDGTWLKSGGAVLEEFEGALSCSE